MTVVDLLAAIALDATIITEDARPLRLVTTTTVVVEMATAVLPHLVPAVLLWMTTLLVAPTLPTTLMQAHPQLAAVATRLTLTLTDTDVSPVSPVRLTVVPQALPRGEIEDTVVVTTNVDPTGEYAPLPHQFICFDAFPSLMSAKSIRVQDPGTNQRTSTASSKATRRNVRWCADIMERFKKKMENQIVNYAPHETGSSKLGLRRILKLT